VDTALPGPVARYYESAARRDTEATVALFTEDAVVVDEDRTRHGTKEIRDWQEGPATQYRYTTEVLGFEATGEDTFLVTGHLEGDFPGGAADLTWRFTLAGDRISRLEIAP